MLPPLVRQEWPRHFDPTLPVATNAPTASPVDPAAAHTDYDLHRSLPVESLQHYIECRLAGERFRVS